jgi:diacylglycerol kinase family enzyme
VLAAEIGLEEHPGELVRAILHGPAVPIHLGVANGRRFTLMAGIGLDAEVVASVNPRLKRRTGKFAYAVATLQRWLEYRRHRFRIEIDGVPHEAAAAVVANGHYYAGRFVCAKEARLTEPMLHVCLFEKPGRWQALYYMVGLFAGFLPRLKTYRVVPGREIAILDDASRPVQGDGDVIARLPVRIRVAEETIPLVMPAAG